MFSQPSTARPAPRPGRSRAIVRQPVVPLPGWQVIAFVVSLLICLAITTGARAAVDAKVRDNPKPLKPFELTDTSGQKFDNERLKGKWSLVAIGFTNCPDVCPFTLQNLAQVREELSLRVSPARLPQVVFIGVDPDRDAPVLGQYVTYFGDDFIGATGDWDNVVAAVEALEGYVRINRKGKSADDYPVFHSAVISLIDPKGRLVAGVNPPMPPAETATFIAELMLKQARKSASN